MIFWFVIVVSLFIIFKLLIGVEIDDFKIVLIFLVVFGFLNVLVSLFLVVVVLFIKIVFLSFLFILFFNMVIFGLVVWFVSGFCLCWGFWSVLIGVVVLDFINFFFYELFNRVVIS